MLNKLKQQNSKLSAEEAYNKLFSSLSEYTGWKVLKSQRCLKMIIGNIVFELRFFSSKYNSSYNSVKIYCEFKFWNKELDNECNINSILGTISLSPKYDYWYDVSNQIKLGKAVKKLEHKIDKYVFPLVHKFEEDYSAGIEYLSTNKIRKTYKMNEIEKNRKN